MPVHVWVSLAPKRGCGEAVAKVLARMPSLVRAEPGCRRYDLFRVAHETGEPAFHLYEVWADAAALEAHRDYPHYAAYRADILPLLASAPDVKMLTAMDVAPF